MRSDTRRDLDRGRVLTRLLSGDRRNDDFLAICDQDEDDNGTVL